MEINVPQDENQNSQDQNFENAQNEEFEIFELTSDGPKEEVCLQHDQ